MTDFTSAEIVQDQEGRQYHIGCGPRDVRPYCIIVGDPGRAGRIAKHFDQIDGEVREREYVTISGSYLGIPLTAMATGIGADNTEIAVIEYASLRSDVTFLRVGSCGALQPGMALGDLCISTGAVRLESTSTFFVHEGYPATAHHEVVLAVLQAASELGFPHHAGVTATGAGFYGAQGRNVPGFPVRKPALLDELVAMGVKNFEMEASCLFSLAGLRGLRAGAVCAVYANRSENQFIDRDFKPEAEARAIQVGLRAIELIHAMDRARGENPYWLPRHGLGGE